MEPVNCILGAGTNSGAAGYTEWQLRFKEGRNFMYSSRDKQIVHEQPCKGLKYQNNTSRQHQRYQGKCTVILKSRVTTSLGEERNGR